MEQMEQYALQEIKAGGASESELAAARAKQTEFAEMYQNFFVRFGITFIEIFPVGLIITLISAALLRNHLFLRRA